MGNPIDRTAKTALDTNLNNGVTSDAPKVKGNNDIIYNYVDTLNAEQAAHTEAPTLPHADQSVTGPKIKDGAVGTNHLASLAVTRPKIGIGAVGSSQLDPTLLTDFGDVAVQAEFDRRGVSVVKYGAVGDGVTDDTASIQAALTAVTNGIVFLPSGYTFITDSLTIANAGVTLFIANGATLKTNGIAVTGTKSGILGMGRASIINGRLKVNPITVQAASGATVLTFSSHDFVVGDGIQSSYGLGGDGSNPITVTAVTATTVTVATPTIFTIPVGAYIGNYGWSATVYLNGDQTFCKNLDIVHAKGYALGAIGDFDIVMDQVNIYNNGLDTMLAGSGVRFYISNSNIGLIYDAAKQGLSMGSNAKIYMYNVKFERDNFDPDFLIFGTHTNTEIYADHCTFVGTSTGIHPAPYNGDGWAVIDLDPAEASTVSNMKFTNCKFYNYNQGIITRPVGNTKNASIGRILISDCESYASVVSGDMRNTTWGEYQIQNSLFDGQNKLTSASEWLQCDDTVTIENCRFVNDATAKSLLYVRLKNNVFDNAAVSLYENSQGDGNTFINSLVSAFPSYDNTSYLRLTNSTFQHDQFTTASDLSGTVITLLPAGSEVIDFKFLNGTLGGCIYNQNFVSKYFVIIKMVGADLYEITSPLYGDDWRIPYGSIVENITAITVETRLKYVSKSNITTTTASMAAFVTSLPLTSVTGMAVGDYLNIKLDNGRVHCSKITSITDLVVVIDTGLPSAASSGNNVCAFLY